MIALGVGLLISARSASLRVAMMAAIMATMLPTMILSGFVFPVASMPRPLQMLCQALPATHFLVVVRGIMLKGQNWFPLQTAILAAMALVILTLAVRSFRLQTGVTAMRPLACLVRKEFLQLRRDTAMLRLVLALPIFQLLLLSYALNNDLRNVRVSVLDEDRLPLGREIADALWESDVFVPGPPLATGDDLAAALQHGRCDLALRIPAGFARDVAQGRSPAVGVHVDGSNSSLGGRAAGYAQTIISQVAAGRDVRAGVVRFFYNPELESRLYMVPGIIVMIVTIISALLTGLAVVREKELGTLEQVQVTPLGSLQFIAGKTLPFALIALMDLALATAFAMAWFHVPLTGSPLVLLLGVLTYLLVTLSLGLLASVVSDTQQQAMFTIWFGLVFAILLSGFFFPIENMPAWARGLTWINPMRFFMAIVRGVLLRGAGLADLADELLVLLAMGVAAFAGAVWAFRRASG